MKYAITIFILSLASARLVYTSFKDKGRLIVALIEYASAIWIMFNLWS